MSKFLPTKDQKEVMDRILEQRLSVLAVAGPGAGKSLVALEVAQAVVARQDPRLVRNVLFLSFSNATIHRLARSAGVHFRRTAKSLQFRTYHSYAADFLSSYGRFVGLPPLIRVIDLLEQRLRLFRAGSAAMIDSTAVFEDLAVKAGLLSFDLLIPRAIDILSASSRLRAIIQRQYPLIVVDEFQDTSEEQWQLLRLIGESAQVLALADPNQIIYSSFGAITSRLEQFETWKKVKRYDFSAENLRCSSSKILTFASSLLNATPFPKTNHENELHFVCLSYRNQLVEYLAQVVPDFAKDGETATLGILVPSNRHCEELGGELRRRAKGAKLSTLPQLVADPTAYDSIPLALAGIADFATSGTDEARHEAALALMTLNSLWNPAFRATAKRQEEIAELLADGLRNASAFAQVFSSIRDGQDPRVVQNALVNEMRKQKIFKVAAERITAHDRVHLRQEHYSRENNVEAFMANRGNDALREDPLTSRIQILNYWKAKGREFDYVILVVDPRAEKTRAAIDEQRRLYYVCATRPKTCLVVVYFRNELGRVLGPVLAPAD